MSVQWHHFSSSDNTFFYFLLYKSLSFSLSCFNCASPITAVPPKTVHFWKKFQALWTKFPSNIAGLTEQSTITMRKYSDMTTSRLGNCPSHSRKGAESTENQRANIEVADERALASNIYVFEHLDGKSVLRDTPNLPDGWLRSRTT